MSQGKKKIIDGVVELFASLACRGVRIVSYNINQVENQDGKNTVAFDLRGVLVEPSHSQQEGPDAPQIVEGE